MWRWALGRHLATIVAVVLVGALMTATMVRIAPGFDVDEQQLDTRLSHESIVAAMSTRAQNRNIFGFYITYFKGVLHGDLGRSQSLNRPVRELVAERLPVSVRLVGFGLLAGWALAIGLAFSAALIRANAYSVFAITIAGALLCIPCAVLALAFVVLRVPAFLAIALVVFPKIFSMARNLLQHSYEMPHVITARAKGLSETRVLLWHVVPVSGAQLITLSGVSLSLALGAAIPVEALCGIPGVGQLAWQAALARDLPLLVTVTMMVCVVTLVSNSTADLLNLALRPQS